MSKERIEDPAMRKVRKLVEGSEMTLQQIGEKMGYSPASARQAVSQFVRSGDPQIGMLRKFAKAMGVKLESLI
jgi:transcriptional regulator with XRE-family HTH domain